MFHLLERSLFCWRNNNNLRYVKDADLVNMYFYAFYDYVSDRTTQLEPTLHQAALCGQTDDLQERQREADHMYDQYFNKIILNLSCFTLNSLSINAKS